MKKIFIIVGGVEKERLEMASEIRREANKKGLSSWPCGIWTCCIDDMLGEFRHKLKDGPTRTELIRVLLKAKTETDGHDWFAKKLIKYLDDASGINVLTVADVTDQEQIRMIREEAAKCGILVFVVQAPTVPYGVKFNPDFKIVPGFTIPVIMNAICKKEESE